jgi:hypothetical protein
MSLERDLKRENGDMSGGMSKSEMKANALYTVQGEREEVS